MNGSIKKLSVAIYWHEHQPIYHLDSVYLMPWARLHAVKDYLDMLLILEKHPKIKLNINVVPTLIDAVVDYAENGINDIHSSLTVTPVEQLTDGEKEYILNNFFSAEYETMIFHHPTYRKLFKKRFAKKDVDINDFTNQEYSDLMALFNLAWIDPTHKNRFPELRQLAAKEKGFTLRDRIKIMDLHRKIISQIIPAHKKFLQQGRIEMTTSPYNHPILPILCDSETVYKNTTNLENLPAIMEFEEDAYNQIKMAIDKFVEVFGEKPKGIWASEHCLTTKVLNLLIDMGIKWTISDESILSKTINFEFVRDFKGNLEDPYHLLKVYNYKNRDSNIDIVFRDSSIPNLINFEYSSMDPRVAAEDLYNKIKLIQSKLLISPDESHLLTIALDGENCWERYKDDGAEFLNKFYSMLEKDSSLETVCLSDYIEEDKSKKSIDGLYAGSWINKDFSFWIGDPIKNLAWNYLATTRNDIIEANRQNPNPYAFENAMKEIYIAEGSDWFWWYGEPNNSGQDNVFDYLFREHLKNAYKCMGLQPPEYLDKSAIVISYQNISEEDLYLNPNDNISFVNSFDLVDGPVYRDSKLFDRIDYGYNEDNILLRLYLNPNFKNSDEFRPKISQFYVYFKRNSKTTPGANIRVSYSTNSDFMLLHKKYHKELMLTFVGKIMYQPYLSTCTESNGWINAEFQNINMPINDVVDITIKFEDLGVKKGQKVEMFFITGSNSVGKTFIPKDVAFEIVRPNNIVSHLD